LPDANVPEAMKDYLIFEDNIRDVIRSWDELSVWHAAYAIFFGPIFQWPAYVN
jgi:hypothetical protein